MAPEQLSVSSLNRRMCLTVDIYLNRGYGFEARKDWEVLVVQQFYI
jgi:hypothetical protein